MGDTIVWLILILIALPFVAIAFMILWGIYWIIKIICNIIWIIRGCPDKDKYSLRPREKSAREQIAEAWAKQGYSGGGGSGGLVPPGTGIVEGWDGTYHIFISATIRIEHYTRNGSMKIYYSVDEIPNVQDQQLVRLYLEDQD